MRSNLGEDSMSRLEWRAAIGLSGIYGLRMFGLFIILPVFALYAAQLPGGDDPFLIGVALGAYGMTQAILQVPFGWLSDRLGRKPIIYLGLILFALGSFVAAGADTLHGIILGRVLQGAGALSSAVIALAADLTREQHRTKVMAMIGATIGLTFALSIVIAPPLEHWVGVPGIFTVTGVLAVSALWVVFGVIPTPSVTVHGDAELKPGQLSAVLANIELMRLNVGIFVVHAVMTGMFLVLPFALRDNGLASDRHWQAYLPVTAVAFALMIPAVIRAERENGMRQVFLGAIATLGVAELMLHFSLGSLAAIALSLVVFFTAFNVLEATLPSILSRVAPAGSKGTATGVYTSLQFLGAAVGGAGGGWIVKHYGQAALFLAAAGLCVVWFAIAWPMRLPAAVKVKTYPLRRAFDGERLSRELAKVPGVIEAVVIATESVAYLKVDRHGFDEQVVLRLIEGG
jgi:MFS family permease